MFWKASKRTGPSNIASGFEGFIVRPEYSEKKKKRPFRFCAEEISDTKTVVSSTYCDSLISLEPTLMPIIFFNCLIAFPSNSIARTNNSPEKGQPCSTPRTRLRKGEAKPLFTIQLNILL